MSEKSERDRKIFQSYLENIKAKTGKTPDDFRALAKEKGLTKAGEIVAWLKKDFGLGYGHAGAIWHLIGHADDVKAGRDDRLAKLFAGKKAVWRKPTGRFEAAGSWNAMVTHRVRISDPKQIDKEVRAWLKQAYDAA